MCRMLEDRLVPEVLLTEAMLELSNMDWKGTGGIEGRAGAMTRSTHYRRSTGGVS